MTPTSRRIFAYWLLLLLPTVGVGVASIYLLRREQARLEERAGYADEARKAAVTARARLIAENIELLVGDMQAGLVEQLESAPAEGLDLLLDRLESGNPLVRSTFRCDASGGILRPGAEAGEEGRAFLRRFGQRLAGAPPWGSVHELQEDKAQMGAAQAYRPLTEEALPVQNQALSFNTMKVQQARKDARQVASSKVRSSSYDSYKAEADSSRSRQETSTGAVSAPPALAKEKKLAEVGLRDELRGQSQELARVPQTPVAAAPSGPPPFRHGWVPLAIEGRLHLLGWVQSGGSGAVRGVELEMAALISRLDAALPDEFPSGEGYALRDDQGRIMHQTGFVPRDWSLVGANRENRVSDSGIVIPLADTLLPGWQVIAFSPSNSLRQDPVGSAFLLVGGLLVTLLLVAIMAGGWLLLRQARQSEAEAVQKTSFVANVSHEFKTPLTTIRLYAELLEQGRVKNPEQGGDYLRTIGRETERLARLVGNALDFSRLEQGRKKYDKASLDLGATVDRMVAMQQPRATEAGVSLRVERPADPLAVTTDRDALEQILLNLIDNAAKYGAAGGEITVQAATLPAGGAVVRVMDRGPGVPRAHWEKIFDKFHRVDDTLTAEKTGTGLGLSIARQLARGLGGDLTYEPRDGGGAAFILTLP